jgi:hypothetical protein
MKISTTTSQPRTRNAFAIALMSIGLVTIAVLPNAGLLEQLLSALKDLPEWWKFVALVSGRKIADVAQNAPESAPDNDRDNPRAPPT